MSTQIQTNVALAPYTSFGVGGNAEKFANPQSADELITLLKEHRSEQISLLGYGSNALISDEGVPGLTILLRSSHIEVNGDEIIADSGVWWDDVVTTAIKNDLWGIELLSKVPGSLGAALYINIAAYGQTIGPRVKWIDVWDSDTHEVRRLEASALTWSYKQSVFQQPEMKKLLIVRACLHLSRQKTDELTYQKALDIAEEKHLNPDDLVERRDIVIEARRRAGSLWHPSDTSARTAGSFFRNPLVTAEQADAIIAHDESGLAADVIRKMNQAHGGDALRVSAAHVMLAAGFQRGQMLHDHVRLHEKNLLKLETLPGAKAREVYEAMRHIQKQVNDTLGIDLEPEVKLLGEF